MFSPKSIMVALALVTATVALGGCFHHREVTTTEYSPPPSRPLK